MIDYSYTELECRVIEVFTDINCKNCCTETLEANYFYAENDDEPDMFFTVLAAVVYEAKNNILTDNLKDQFKDYSTRWDNGEFKADILPEDIPIIQKDIDFVRSTLKD